MKNARIGKGGRVPAALIRASNYVFLVMALVGQSIVNARNVFLYVALLVAGILFPHFAAFIVSCLLCWAYKRNLDRAEGTHRE